MWLEIPVLFGSKWHESNVIMYKKSPKKNGYLVTAPGTQVS